MDREERAQAVVRYIQGTRRALLDRVKDVPEADKPLVYIGGIGFKGAHGIESTETNYPPFGWVAARNAADRVAEKGGKTTHLFIDKEKLLQIDPDVIFIDGGGNELVRRDYEKKTAFYQGLKAFQNNRVHSLHSFNWYMTNLGTVITDAYAVGTILYPEQFEDVDLAERADAVYDYLVGRPVYEDMKEIHGRLGRTPPYLKQ
jgi:iron complex transport system substrate-binding protein